MIGNYILSGRFQAIASTSLSAILSMMLPPFAYVIGGSVLGLITLRKGPVISLQVMIASFLVLTVLSVVAGLSVHLALAYAIVIWLPIWVTSTALRLTERQGLLLVSAGTLAISLTITIYIVIGDVATWWQQWLDIMLEKAVPPEQLGQYKEALEPAAAMLNAMMAVGLMLNIVMSVFFARWWQSRLFIKGAFKKEFHELQLPAMILPVSAIIVVLALTMVTPWKEMFRDIMVIMMFMYLIQGISAVHRNVELLNLSAAWLVAMYCLLILLPHMAMFIAFLGITDIYIVWRKKKIGSENES